MNPTKTSNLRMSRVIDEIAPQLSECAKKAILEAALKDVAQCTSKPYSLYPRTEVAPSECSLRFHLGSEDIPQLRSMDPLELKQKLHDWDPIWCVVLGSQIKKNKHLFIEVDSPHAKQSLTPKGDQVREALGLSKDCYVLPDLYYVKGQFNPHVSPKTYSICENIENWKKDLQIRSIVQDRCHWYDGHLILAISNEIEAAGVCYRRVALRGNPGSFLPYDMRSRPLRCYNCYRFGHTQRDCAQSSRCGWCAQSHHTDDCKQKVPNMCARCEDFRKGEGRGHTAWSPKCPHPQAREAMAKAQAHEARGPAWGERARLNLLLKQTNNPNMVQSEQQPIYPLESPASSISVASSPGIQDSNAKQAQGHSTEQQLLQSDVENNKSEVIIVATSKQPKSNQIMKNYRKARQEQLTTGNPKKRRASLSKSTSQTGVLEEECDQTNSRGTSSLKAIFNTGRDKLRPRKKQMVYYGNSDSQEEQNDCGKAPT
ncbi:hypothetical protein HD806DRAFT_502607 [Xylariaceae sp. AK1471]|nr:hypothetical protein HD806DRAFT_502607 [Xylariaceae sp. AK1471]